MLLMMMLLMMMLLMMMLMTAVKLHSVCSQLVTPFQVDFAEPFKIEPRDGTLLPNSSMKFKASFQPKVTCSVRYNTI